MSKRKKCPECKKMRLNVEKRRVNFHCDDDENSYITACSGCCREERIYWDRVFGFVPMPFF